MDAVFTVNGLFAGRAQPLGPRGAPSCIVKSAVASLTVREDGTDEDDQANKRLHGGPEKVLHQFAPINYLTLQKHFPDGKFVAGSIGENISAMSGADGASFFTSKNFNTTIKELTGRFDQVFLCSSNKNAHIGLMALSEFEAGLVLISGLRRTKKIDIKNNKSRQPIDILFHD